MTFGAVQRVEDIPEYYARIRGGQPPSEDRIVDLRQRYVRIGGSSPLLAILRRQAEGLEGSLRRKGLDVPVEAGMRFWNPSIKDGVQALVDRGVKRIVGITSGPYDSPVSVGGYERMLQAAVASIDPGVGIEMIRQWHQAPGLDSAWEKQYQHAIEQQGWGAGSFHVLLTCHALPQRVLVTGDSYPGQFLAHAHRLAAHLKLARWGACFQSAGLTDEPWIGPDILQAISLLKGQANRVMVLPIGFSADHLEILHDLDLEAAGHASALGIQFARAPSLNDSPALVETWANVLQKRLDLQA